MSKRKDVVGNIWQSRTDERPSTHLPFGLDTFHLARRLLPDAATPPKRQADPHVGEAHAGERQDVRQHHQHHRVSGGAARETNGQEEQRRERSLGNVNGEGVVSEVGKWVEEAMAKLEQR